MSQNRMWLKVREPAIYLITPSMHLRQYAYVSRRSIWSHHQCTSGNMHTWAGDLSDHTINAPQAICIREPAIYLITPSMHLRQYAYVSRRSIWSHHQCTSGNMHTWAGDLSDHTINAPQAICIREPAIYLITPSMHLRQYAYVSRRSIWSHHQCTSGNMHTWAGDLSDHTINAPQAICILILPGHIHNIASCSNISYLNAIQKQNKNEAKPCLCLSLCFNIFLPLPPSPTLSLSMTHIGMHSQEKMGKDKIDIHEAKHGEQKRDWEWEMETEKPWKRDRQTDRQGGREGGKKTDKEKQQKYTATMTQMKTETDRYLDTKNKLSPIV